MGNEKIGGAVSKQSKLIIGVMLSGAFIAVLNQTVLSPALPSIMRDMGITASMGQWLTTAFMLVNGIMIPITAFLIDRFTTRQLFGCSMVLFTLGTLLCGITPNFSILMVGRVLQAMGAGILMPLIQTVVLWIYPKERRGAAMGTIGIIIAFAPAIGPTLAGWVVDGLGWHMLFLMIAPLAGIDILLSLFLLKNVGETSKPKLDVVSVIYSTLGFGGLLYGFSSAGTYGWLHYLTYGPLVVGAVTLIIFIKRQVILEKPLLEMRLLKNKTFTYSTVISMILNAALLSGTIITPLYLQNILGFTAMQSGLVMLPGAIIMGIMSPITGKLFDRFGPRALALIGLSTMTAGSALLVFIDDKWVFWMICLVYTVRMSGMALIMMPVNTWGLNAIDNQMIPHGSAINNTFRQVAGSIGTAVLVTIMTMTTNSAAHLGATAATLHGMRIAYGAGAALSAVAFVIAILFVRQSKILPFSDEEQ